MLKYEVLVMHTAFKPARYINAKKNISKINKIKRSVVYDKGS
jgi:hypothetical protein